MLNKIISGGQTGADRAALDVAIKFNIPHGGWIPKGRKTENGPLPDFYILQEMESRDYRDRTKRNIEISTGTAIISRGRLTGGSKLTLQHAKVVGKPVIHIDLATTEDFEAALFLKSFILENQVAVLNVAGARESHAPWIYEDVKMLLEAVLYLLYLDTGLDRELNGHVPGVPDALHTIETIDQAVEKIAGLISLKTKTLIARYPEAQMTALYFAFMEFIRSFVGFDLGNKTLLKECSGFMHWENPSVEDAAMVILKQLKAELEKKHILRVVK